MESQPQREAERPEAPRGVDQEPNEVAATITPS